MEFKFKRKYTGFTVTALLLHVLVLLFWFFTPSDALEGLNGKNTITLLALINVELILIFYLGLYKKKYFAFHDKLIIKRSFLKTLTIKYSSITTIKENQNDTVLLFLGHRPSFIIYFTNSLGRRKKVTVRSDNSELLLKVIKNEIEITKIK